MSGVSAPANPPDVHLEGELHVRRAQDGGGPDVATGDVRTGATTPSTGARTDGTAAGSDALTDDATAPAGGATPGADDAGAADREPGGAAGIDTVDRKTDVDALVGGPTENLRRSGMGRRWLAPLAVAAVILAVVGATWAIARAGATVPGNPSAARGTAPAAAGASSPAPGAPSPAAAPGAASPASPVVGEAVFTGRTSDNAVTIAVGVKDGRAAGYLCDGSTVEAWLEGTIGGADVTLHGRDPSTVLTAKADPRGLFGTITVGGVSRPFSAAAATGAAGLYQSKRVLKGISVRIGWIVLPDGTQVGIRNEDGVRTPAPALDPATGAAVDGGETVSAERVSGGTVVIG